MTTLLQQLHDTVRIALSAVTDLADTTIDEAEEAVYAGEMCVRILRPTLGPVEYVVEVGEDAVEVYKGLSLGMAATQVALEVARVNIDLALADLGAKEEAEAMAAMEQW